MITGGSGAWRAGIAAIVLLLAAAGGYLLLEGGDDDALAVPPAPDVAPAEGVLPSSDRQGAEVDAPDPSKTPAAAQATAPAAPSLDVVRIDALGGSLAAGRAPGAEDVVLRLDGETVAAATIDAEGNFVALFDVPLTAAPRLLTVEARDRQGAVTPGPEDVIVASARAAAGDVPALGDLSVAEAAAGKTGLAVAEPPAEDAARLASDGSRPAAPSASDAAERAVSGGEPSDRSIPEPAFDGPEVDTAGPMASNAPVGTPSDAPSERAGPSATTSAPGDAITDGGPAAPPAGMPRGAAALQADASPPVALDGVVGIPPQTTAARLPEPPRLIRSGPAGIQLAQGASRPDVTETLGLDAIAYDVGGDVQLSGRAAPDEALRIYLDGVPVQTARSGSDGAWSSALPNVRTGVYTLRVDAVAEDGSVTARVETPFQRTAPEIAAAARRDGLTAITVQPGFTLWAISRGWFGDGVRYVQIFEANRDQIRDPDLIYPGQVFAMPPDAADAR